MMACKSKVSGVGCQVSAFLPLAYGCLPVTRDQKPETYSSRSGLRSGAIHKKASNPTKTIPIKIKFSILIHPSFCRVS